MYGQINLKALSKQTTSEDEFCRLQTRAYPGYQRFFVARSARKYFSLLRRPKD